MGLMAMAIGGALEGGGDAALKGIQTEQASDLQMQRDQRLAEYMAGRQEAHDQRLMTMQQAHEDRRDAQQRADLDSRERRATEAADAAQRRTETRETEATRRAEAREERIMRESRAHDAEITRRLGDVEGRKATREEEVARHNRVSELSKLAQSQLSNGLTDDYNRTMMEIRVLNNPPGGANMPPAKPGNNPSAGGTYTPPAAAPAASSGGPLVSAEPRTTITPNVQTGPNDPAAEQEALFALESNNAQGVARIAGSPRFNGLSPETKQSIYARLSKP